MNAVHWGMMILLAALASAAMGAFAGRWWTQRRTLELLLRLDKLEKARQVAGQHAAQARKQIEQLQKDIAAQHKARAEARSARKRELNESLDAADSALRNDPAEVAAIERPALPAHGFADTQPLA